MTKPIPKVQQPPVQGGGIFTREWYDFFRSLTGLDGAALQAEIAALAARVEALENGQSLEVVGNASILAIRTGDVVTLQLQGDFLNPGGGWYYGTNEDGLKGFWPVADAIVGTGSIVSTINYGPYNFRGELDAPSQLPVPAVIGDAYLIGGNLWVGEDDGGLGWNNTGPAKTKSALAFVNDEAAPNPTHYYGTNTTGAKGWHAVADTVDVVAGELNKIVGGDGVTTFGLANVADAGGGVLQKTAFDAKGRKTGTSAATTSDLPEGANLYFTNARVHDALSAFLSAFLVSSDGRPLMSSTGDFITSSG